MTWLLVPVEIGAESDDDGPDAPFAWSPEEGGLSCNLSDEGASTKGRFSAGVVCAGGTSTLALGILVHTWRGFNSITCLCKKDEHESLQLEFVVSVGSP